MRDDVEPKVIASAARIGIGADLIDELFCERRADAQWCRREYRSGRQIGQGAQLSAA
jgi:hypothetical protein